MVGFTDSNWADNPDDRKSTACYVFSVWGLDMSLGLVRNNKLFSFFSRGNIEPQLMPVKKLYGFDRSFHSLDLSSSIRQSFGVTIKVPSNSPKIQFNINAANTLS